MKLATLVPAFSVAAALTLISTPAQANGSRFACDTASGRSSEFTIPLLASEFRMTGTVQPILFRTDADWIPTAVLGLRNPETGNTLSIRLAAPNGEAEGAFVSLAVNNGEGEQRSGVGTLALENTVNFALTYRQAGDSEIVIGEQAFPISSDLGNRFDMSIGCSTGDFVFDRLVWQIGTPPG